MGVTILLKGGRDIATTHNWEELKVSLNENPADPEVVVQEVITGPSVNGSSTTLAVTKNVWTCIKKAEIQGYRNI